MSNPPAPPAPETLGGIAELPSHLVEGVAEVARARLAALFAR